MSDLHLEFRKPDGITIIVGAEYLILAGDIGYPSKPNFERFLKRVNELYKKVFVILGNHEFYHPSSDMDCIIGKVSLMCARLSNVVLLNNSSYLLDDKLLIVGTTLWSYVSPANQLTVEHSMNDYNCIKNFTVSSNNDLHQKAVQYLDKTLTEAPQDSVLVITHHLPSYQLIHEQYQLYNKLNSAFASELDQVLLSKHQHKIKAWCFGHSHSSTKKMVEGVLCISNPLGYPNESTSFREKCIFTVEV